MRLTDSGLRLSASDLAHFLACRHLTALDLGVASKARERPVTREDPRLERIRERGIAHEATYVQRLRDQGLGVVDLNDIPFRETERAIAATRQAMQRGDEIIVQACLHNEQWFGFADVLRRTPVPSTLGPWSYEALDTKLARETRAGTILQLGLYSAMLGAIQGETPELFHVVVPGTDTAEPIQHTYRTDDFAAYFRLIQRELVEGVASGHEALGNAHYPEPVEFCDICRWWRQCNDRRRADDHLSLVANLGRIHRRELEANDYPTLTLLAGLPVQIPFKPKRGSPQSYMRAQQQAFVQLQSRTLKAPSYTLRRPEPLPPGERSRPTPPPPQGFARLPEPSHGDLFLDLEGDHASDEGGREYLFGFAWRDADGTVQYDARWALTPEEERLAFEEIIDRIIAAIERDPGMHVYHFAPYEPSAFKRLMGRYATREQALDRLLRGRRLVDLFGVVRQGLFVGVESYSIKQLEPCYDFVRDVHLPDASAAMRRMEYALELRSPDLVSLEDRRVIEGYNKDDCVSTLHLRDWLERVRLEAQAAGIPVDRPVPPDDEQSPTVKERDLAVQVLRERLIGGLGPDPAALDSEQQARWILAYLLDYHRREDKATWWEYFRLREMTEDELLDERLAISKLEFVERVNHGTPAKKGGFKGSVIDRYRYPDQEMDLDPRDKLRTATDGNPFARIVAVDRVAKTLDLSKSRPKAEIHPTALFEFTHVPPVMMEDAISAFAASVATAGSLTDAPPAASAELLLRNPPRLKGSSRDALVAADGETVLQTAIRVVQSLDHSFLAIQGPPGAGKTYTGAEMICALVKSGKRVGVTANSHKVIRKLLEETVTAAGRYGIAISIGHRDKEDGDEAEAPAGTIQSFKDNPSAADAISSGGVKVLGGTAWMWARPEFKGMVDVLVVDEAGQMALANVVAVSQAADNLVLLGDPQQLDQPRKGSHPDGVALSALEHLIGDEPTLPADRGLFLPTTWRMSPKLCAFTSELYYRSRLRSRNGLDRQVLANAGAFTGSGLHVWSVEHQGNRNHSPEEVDAIVELVGRLTSDGVYFCPDKGNARQMTVDDILVVSPYNTQVNRLIEALPAGARVGTVDKFQGQQAPVVIYSMATSHPEDAPRGMDFLYSANRLNVATSRAQCVVILVASPHLFKPECRTVKQMRLANGLCRFREMATLLA